jgi:hypothetical protein
VQLKYERNDLLFETSIEKLFLVAGGTIKEANELRQGIFAGVVDQLLWGHTAGWVSCDWLRAPGNLIAK